MSNLSPVIEQLRQRLDDMVASPADLRSPHVIRVSQALDRLIVMEQRRGPQLNPPIPLRAARPLAPTYEAVQAG